MRQLIDPLIAAAVAFSIGALLVVGYVRDSKRRDTTSAVASIVALGLGLLAGAGQPALAVAGAAVVTLLLRPGRSRTASSASSTRPTSRLSRDLR